MVIFLHDRHIIVNEGIPKYLIFLLKLVKIVIVGLQISLGALVDGCQLAKLSAEPHVFGWHIVIVLSINFAVSILLAISVLLVVVGRTVLLLVVKIGQLLTPNVSN
jgi:hypothetical protein